MVIWSAGESAGGKFGSHFLSASPSHTLVGAGINSHNIPFSSVAKSGKQVSRNWMRISPTGEVQLQLVSQRFMKKARPSGALA